MFSAYQHSRTTAAVGWSRRPIARASAAHRWKHRIIGQFRWPQPQSAPVKLRPEPATAVFGFEAYERDSEPRYAVADRQQFRSHDRIQVRERVEQPLSGCGMSFASNQLAVRKFPQLGPAGGVRWPLDQQHP